MKKNNSNKSRWAVAIIFIPIFSFIMLTLLNPKGFSQPEKEVRLKLLWEHTFPYRVNSGAISTDSKYIVVATDVQPRLAELPRIFSFDTRGKLLWKQSLKGRVCSVSTSKTNYILASVIEPFSEEDLGSGMGWNFCYLFDREGRLCWKKEVRPEDCSMAHNFSSNGKFIIGANDYRFPGGGYREVVVYNLDGSLYWQKRVKHQPYAAAISDDGNYIAIGNRWGEVSFYNKEGELLWNFQARAWTEFSEIIISEDSKHILIRCPGLYGALYVLDSQGRPLLGWDEKILRKKLPESGQSIKSMQKGIIELSDQGKGYWGNIYHLDLKGNLKLISTLYQDVEKAYREQFKDQSGLTTIAEDQKSCLLSSSDRKTIRYFRIK